MDVPPPTVQPPRPQYCADGQRRPDVYVPEWFPEDYTNKDEYKRAWQRQEAYYKWAAISDAFLREKFLRDHTASFGPAELSSEADSSDSSVAAPSAFDSPPRPRKRASTPPKKLSANQKRCRTMRRKQNPQYRQVFEALEPLRKEMQLTDRQFCSLLQRYKTELNESRQIL